jgi:hypothetical protein
LDDIEDVPTSLLAFAVFSCREVSIISSRIRDDSTADPFIMGPQETRQQSTIEDLQLTFWPGNARDGSAYILATGLYRHLNRLRKLKVWGISHQAAHLRRFMFESSFSTCLEDLHLNLADGASVDGVTYLFVI